MADNDRQFNFGGRDANSGGDFPSYSARAAPEMGGIYWLFAKLSFGLIKNLRQAQIAAIIFILIMTVGSFFIYWSGTRNTATAIPPGMKIVSPPNALPRLEPINQP